MFINILIVFCLVILILTIKTLNEKIEILNGTIEFLMSDYELTQKIKNLHNNPNTANDSTSHRNKIF
jgi:predicted Holliday junction resolvase-like endonuclease